MKKPIIDECFADNGEHSHWQLIDADSGAILWEQPEDEETQPQPHTITASDLYNTKIRVTPEESVLVQNKAFELGYKWIVEEQKVSFVNAEYLLFSDNKLILYMKWDEGIDFMAHKFKEITLKDILG